ncbi:hypothetical protein SDC9_183106 [bioreactor metagenome]|uniref:Uncharacterized protein n=1 Tax=bioreactor metagenome TaxID=1076179 RepID=A0A645H9F0_9ZZZZ
MADRQGLDQFRLKNIDADLVKRCLRVFAHPQAVQAFQAAAEHPADRVGPGDLAVELNIFCHRKAGDQHKLLMDHADPKFDRLMRRLDPDVLAFHLDIALKSAGTGDHRHTEQYIHQGGLARSVFTEQCMDLSGLDVQADILEHLVFTIALGYAVHLQHKVAHAPSSCHKG